MINLNFNYNGNNIKIQCKLNENIKEIFKKLANKIQKDIKDLYFLYNGIKVNEGIKLEDINNKEDQINIISYQGLFPLELSFRDYAILVCDINNDKNNNIIKNPKDIICPECGKNCLINIKDYKIDLYKCDNKHYINNILLKDFYNSQIKYESQLVCNNCYQNHKEIYNNKIYKCCNCDINLCPLCKSNHNNEHIIIDYELINYICNIHNERYTSYCKQCEINICSTCEITHNFQHSFIYHRDIIKNKGKNNIIELKIKINELKNEINDIISKLNKIKEYMDIYYSISENIINTNTKNRNYQILMNKSKINEYNKNIIKDINSIINEKNTEIKFKFLYQIYIKMINENEFLIHDKEKEKFGNEPNFTKIYKSGKYIGKLKNNKREGKGIMYYNNGDRYEGEYKNDKREGKGLYYFNKGQYKGDRYEGDWKNNAYDGKGIYYFCNGNRYEGDYKDGKKEGKGIMYYNNGDREMGDYLNGKEIGKHVTLHFNGNITNKNY